MNPFWAYFAVAAAIALMAYAVGQIVPGLGLVVVAGLSTLWVAYCVAQGRKARSCFASR